MARTPCAVVVSIGGSASTSDPSRHVDELATTIWRFGGQLQVAGPVTVLEGDDGPQIAAVLVFPDAVAAASWFDSPEQAAARHARAGTGSKAVLVEPAQPPP